MGCQKGEVMVMEGVGRGEKGMVGGGGVAGWGRGWGDGEMD